MRLALLMLLAVEGSRNGYQLMQGLEQRSEGRWRPSPGSVYPALAQLEDEGLIKSVDAAGGSGHSYELTDAGRLSLSESGAQKPPWEPTSDDDTALAIQMRDAVASLGRVAWHLAQDGTPEQIQEAITTLEQTRRRFYGLLAGDDPK